MRTRLSVAALAGTALVVTLVAGCSATSVPSGDSNSLITTGGATVLSPPPNTPPPTGQSTPARTSETRNTDASAPPSLAPSTPPSASSTAPRPVPRSTCTKLTIRVLIGSAAPGYEFAALQFVNDGSTRCTLAGVPTVSLFRGGARVGTISTASTPSAVYRTYALTPGATAESRLKDFSSCNAPLSDTIEVVAPGSSIRTKRPGQLRACRLRVDPLTAPE